ncbi:hypothetical protein Bca4012_021329 [Brassica carinata]
MKLLNDEQKLKTKWIYLISISSLCRKLNKTIRKKRKKHKDPLKPKHPISAFLVYANERRAAFREENKNVLEMTVEDWKKLSSEQKTPYEEVYLLLYICLHRQLFKNLRLRYFNRWQRSTRRHTWNQWRNTKERRDHESKRKKEES